MSHCEGLSLGCYPICRGHGVLPADQIRSSFQMTTPRREPKGQESKQPRGSCHHIGEG